MFGKNKNTVGLPKTSGDQRKESLGRLLALKIGLVLFFAIIAMRLVQIQVVEAPKYKEIARKQYETPVPLPATRGNIYDRNGKILVSNTMFVSFGADPTMIGDNTVAVAERFARVFGKSRSFYLDKLSSPNKHFVWLERRVDPQYVKRINAEELEGVVQFNEPKRLYHYGRLAGQMIGFTDVDNKGLSGVELQFDQYLNGVNGRVIMQRDGLGRRRPSVDYPRVEPVNGNNIVLTLDLEYQSIVEEELRRGIERNKATSGLVILMEPSTGEVLAMANYPGIDPGNVSTTDQSLIKNRVVTDMFEPGSVFKVVTVSAALEHDLVRPEQKFFAENGSYTVVFTGGSRIISDTHPHGMLTFQEAMEVSSNIVMAKVSDRIGAELLYTTARNFGFGIATGLELPGEVSGDLKRPNQWSGTTLNTMAYGYEVGVTPLQIIDAYASVANNGTLMKPSVLKQVTDEHGELVSEFHPQVIRKVITKSTAKTLTDFLKGVVERGTGVTARLEGVSIAGKTGTSRKFVDGKYELGSYTASFVGFFPAEDPKAVCLVMLDNPRIGGYTGGLASAPIFRNIAEKLVASSARFTKQTDQLIVGTQPLVVPDVTNLSAKIATSTLDVQGFKVEMHGQGNIVLRQFPPPGAKLRRAEAVKLTTEWNDEAVPKGFIRVPDVRGLTIRRAVNLLTMSHLDVNIAGSGIVRGQRPLPGQQVQIGMSVAVQCTPRSAFLVARQ